MNEEIYYVHEEGTVTHSSILAWRSPWTEQPGRLHTPQGHKESDTTEATEHTPCSWIEKLNIVKMSVLHKLVCRFKVIPTEI